MSLQRVAAPAAAVGELLAAYRPGSAFFSSADGAVLGEGELTVAHSLDGVADTLAAVTTPDRVRPIAIGAVPFDARSPARLVVPETVRYAVPSEGRGAADNGQARHPLQGQWRIRAVPEPTAHVRAVERGLKLLADATPGTAQLRKLVLARCLRLSRDEPVDVAQLLGNLARRDPHGFTFAVDLPRHTPDHRYDADLPRTLVGASPELLVAKRAGQAVAQPLAGSAPRSADSATDQRRAADLLASAKDRHEHALTVEAVATGLRPFCRQLRVPPEPELVKTATMWHLATRVTGELHDPATSSAELARALHPTPAICGTPTEAARDTITDIEPFDRGFYAGAVGYCDAAGDGEWVVAIRCAEVAGGNIDLFAGGGIVPESDPESELAETSAKLRTLLLALGLDQSL
ncbi:isochorismate synthase [Salinactinospora qingdaonensis]|uniref:isochorismate synthase n=1 Tax=Salinactinospora qingdaonensis TaxID=702744 RepID=A0ABP7F1Y9_9ACTN